MIERIIENPGSDDTIENIIRNSGKDYNDFGRYEDCLNITDYYYILVTMPKAFPIPISIGLCLPNKCTKKDVENFKPYMLDFINGAIPEVFDGIKGFDAKKIIKASDI